MAATEEAAPTIAATSWCCSQNKTSPVVITNAHEAWGVGEQANEEVSGSMSSKDSNEGRPITSAGV